MSLDHDTMPPSAVADTIPAPAMPEECAAAETAFIIGRWYVDDRGAVSQLIGLPIRDGRIFAETRAFDCVSLQRLDMWSKGRFEASPLRAADTLRAWAEKEAYLSATIDTSREGT